MKFNKILDLSQELYHNCPVAPTIKPPEINIDTIAARDGSTKEEITRMSTHTATHMDAPAHFLDDGITLDKMSINSFQGEMVIIPLEKGSSEPISVNDIKPYDKSINSNSIVLFYTGWGAKAGFNEEWLYKSPYLSLEAADYLVNKNIKGTGIDHFSIGGIGEYNKPVHKKLLGKGIWIVENVELDNPELLLGKWHLISLPIKIRNAGGAPCRVIAIQNDK